MKIKDFSYEEMLHNNLAHNNSLIYHYGKLLPLVSDQISRIKIMYHFSHLLVSTSNKYKTVFNPSFSLSELLSDLK